MPNILSRFHFHFRRILSRDTRYSTSTLYIWPWHSKLLHCSHTTVLSPAVQNGTLSESKTKHCSDHSTEPFGGISTETLNFDDHKNHFPRRTHFHVHHKRGNVSAVCQFDNSHKMNLLSVFCLLSAIIGCSYLLLRTTFTNMHSILFYSAKSLVSKIYLKKSFFIENLKKIELL